MTIIFYDIPSTLPENAFSRNSWKARYCLNYKGVPYKTEWIEYPDIERHCLKFGILPTSTKPDGKPLYTLPALHDPSTGAYISDSLLIAEYLEKTYPSSPSLFPHNTIGVLWPFNDAFEKNLAAIWPFCLPLIGQILTPVSEPHFRRSTEAQWGKPLEDLVPKGDADVEQWAKFKKDLGNVDVWYSKSGGPYLLGDTISWADLSIAAYFVWMRTLFGKDSQKWKDVISWHDGRWKGLIDNLKKYETIV